MAQLFLVVPKVGHYHNGPELGSGATTCQGGRRDWKNNYCFTCVTQETEWITSCAAVCGAPGVADSRVAVFGAPGVADIFVNPRVPNLPVGKLARLSRGPPRLEP